MKDKKMKKIIYSIVALIFLSINTNAAVLTVSTNVSVKAMYSDVTAAMNAANPGDTLYLHYCPTCDYGTLNLTKPLSIIGENWNTYIGTIYFNDNIDMNNTVIEGLNIAYLNEVDYNGGYSKIINSLTVKNCKLNSIAIQGSNWKLYNNYIFTNDGYSPYINILNSSNTKLYNNIIYYHTNYNWQYGSFRKPNNTSQTELVIKNCIFIGNATYSNLFTGIKNASFINNIFYGADPRETNNCFYHNNLTFSCENNGLPYTTNGGENNIINQNPLFVNAPIGEFSFSNDYRLTSNSPAKNAGIDGTDIGISGGTFPWRTNLDGTYDMSGEPKLPKALSVVVTPKILNFNNQQVQVQATGKKK